MLTCDRDALIDLAHAAALCGPDADDAYDAAWTALEARLSAPIWAVGKPEPLFPVAE